MEDCDVLIVGAGLAGLEAARLLARRGRRVLLADRKQRLDQAVHTSGIFVRRSLESFPLPEEHLGPPVRHVRLYSPAGRCLPLESPHDEFRIGRMGPLYCHLLDAAREAGAMWQGGATFVAASQHAGGCTAEFEHEGERRTVGARYVIGADGAGSRVARSLGLSANRHWIVGVEEVLENVPLDGPPCLHCFLDPRLAPGYIAWLAHDGEEAHLGVGGYASRFDPHAALDEFRLRASRIVPLDDAVVLERRGGRIPVGGVLPEIVNRCGLLVGDAAGAVSPLTAGGLDPCLRQADLAASVVDEFLKHGRESTLAAYHSAPFRRRFRLRRLLRGLLGAVRQRWVAEALLMAAAIPPLRQLAWHVFFGRGSFPDTTAAQAAATADADLLHAPIEASS